MTDEAYPDPVEPRSGALGGSPDDAVDAASLKRNELRESILELLADGNSLSAICRKDDMPCWRTVHNWVDADEDFAAQITRAREAGYSKRADDAILAAKTASDAKLGRLAFDAERWYLGKLSNAFSDNKTNKTELSGKLIHGIEIEFVDKDED